MDERNRWFESLYQENAPRMVALAARLLNYPAVAEELVNEAFLILLAHEQEVREHPNPAGWLWETLKNLIKSELKRAKYRRERPLEEGLQAASEDPHPIPLAECLPPGLTEREREILLLFYEEGLSYEEIGARLQLSILACGARLTRARAHCRDLLRGGTGIRKKISVNV